MTRVVSSGHPEFAVFGVANAAELHDWYERAFAWLTMDATNAAEANTKIAFILICGGKVGRNGKRESGNRLGTKPKKMVFGSFVCIFFHFSWYPSNQYDRRGYRGEVDG